MSEKQKDYVTWTIFIWAIGILMLVMGWVRVDTVDSLAKTQEQTQAIIKGYDEKEARKDETLSSIKVDVGIIKTNLEYLKAKK